MQLLHDFENMLHDSQIHFPCKEGSKIQTP